MIINQTGKVLRERGISVRQLALKADIVYNTALNISRGAATRVDLPVLDRICKALNVQPGDLLIWVPDPEDQAEKTAQPQATKT